MDDKQRKQDSYLSIQTEHDKGNPPHIVHSDIGFSYAGAFAIWSILKNGKWTACRSKPKTKETRQTMENY